MLIFSKYPKDPAAGKYFDTGMFYCKIKHALFNKNLNFKNSAEIGYVFNPLYYGKGYATESCRRTLEYGFEQLNAYRIVAMCNPENISSWKLLERLSMRREGHLRKNIYFKHDKHGDPIWNDTYEYAILADEWKDCKAV